mgnify:CR=1 FL=1
MQKKIEEKTKSSWELEYDVSLAWSPCDIFLVVLSEARTHKEICLSSVLL